MSVFSTRKCNNSKACISEFCWYSFDRVAHTVGLGATNIPIHDVDDMNRTINNNIVFCLLLNYLHLWYDNIVYGINFHCDGVKTVKRQNCDAGGSVVG
jgi:hypothetical protein